MLCQALLGERLGPLNALSRAARLILADSLLEVGDIHGTYAALAALYTTDAQVLPPNGEPITGRAAIQKFWQGVMDSGVKGAKLTTVEAAAAGDMAHEVGTYELSGADGKVLDSGKYIVIWKRDGGQWKLQVDGSPGRPSGTCS